MIDWISVKEKLPEHNQRVLIWNGGVDVATFKHGISEEERELMKQGKLEDWEEKGWCASIYKSLGIYKCTRWCYETFI